MNSAAGMHNYVLATESRDCENTSIKGTGMNGVPTLGGCTTDNVSMQSYNYMMQRETHNNSSFAIDPLNGS